MILYRLLFSLLVLLFSSIAGAADSNLRAFEHADLSDSRTLIECMAAMKRSGQPMVFPSIVYARMDQGLLQEIAGRVLDASVEEWEEMTSEQFSDLQYLGRSTEEMLGWYHIGARSGRWRDWEGGEHAGVQVGEQFATRSGSHRWTKIYQSSSSLGGREVWLSPDGSLVGDFIGNMNHFDAQRINRALRVLFEEAVYFEGTWRWPKEVNGIPFEAATFLKQEMAREISIRQLPGGRDRGFEFWDVARVGNVGKYYDLLMDSVGKILEPDFPWQLPESVLVEVDSAGGARDTNELRAFGALEVLPGFREGAEHRQFWTSVVYVNVDSAYVLDGYYGVIDLQHRDDPMTSLRLIARPRTAPEAFDRATK